MDFKNVFKDIKQNIEHDTRNQEFCKKTSIEEYSKVLDAFHISFTEKEVISKYKRLKAVSKVTDYYFDKYQTTWDLIDDKHELEFTSDSLYYYVELIIRNNFDVEELVDPYFIESKMNYIETSCKKEDIQKELMDVLAKLIRYAKSKKYKTIYEVEIAYDMNEFLKTYIKRCYNRDKAFNQAIADFYKAFKDIDQTIYKVKL